MAEKSLLTKAQENQSVGKGALIVAGTTLLAAGVPLCERENPLVGLVLVSLGVACLVLRELIKLKK